MRLHLEAKDLEHPDLSNLTVVILTTNRPELLNRALEFWAAVDVSVLVLDGSEEPQFPKPSARLTYVHARESFLSRMRIAADLVKTEFVILAGDDEFYIPTALLSCVRFLSDNPEYLAACGQATGFFEGRRTGELAEVYPQLKKFNLHDDSPEERLGSHLRAYLMGYYWSVSRSPTWSRAWKAVSEEEFTPFAVHELQFETLMAFAGKSRALPILMWFRNLQVAGVRVRGMASYDPSIRFETWWNSPATFIDKERFIKKMVELLQRFESEPDLSSIESLRSLTVESFDSYVNLVNSKRKVLSYWLLFPLRYVYRSPGGFFFRLALRFFRELRWLAVRNFSDDARYRHLISLSREFHVDWKWVKVIRDFIQDRGHSGGA